MNTTHYVKFNPATKGYTVHLDRFGNDEPIAEVNPVRVPGTPHHYYQGADTAFASPGKAAADLLGLPWRSVKGCDDWAPRYTLRQVGSKCSVFIPGFADEVLKRCRRASNIDGIVTIEQAQGSEWVAIASLPEDTPCYIDAKASCIPGLALTAE